MNKFNCTNQKCIDAHDYEDEDIRLILNIEEGNRYQYYVNSDGTLEYYDGEGTGQEVYLECQVCGQRYEFDIEFDHIPEQHVLPLHHRKYREIGIRKTDSK